MTDRELSDLGYMFTDQYFRLLGRHETKFGEGKPSFRMDRLLDVDSYVMKVRVPTFRGDMAVHSQVSALECATRGIPPNKLSGAMALDYVGRELFEGDWRRLEAELRPDHSIGSRSTRYDAEPPKIKFDPPPAGHRGVDWDDLARASVSAADWNAEYMQNPCSEIPMDPEPKPLPAPSPSELKRAEDFGAW